MNLFLLYIISIFQDVNESTAASNNVLVNKAMNYFTVQEKNKFMCNICNEVSLNC